MTRNALLVLIGVVLIFLLAEAKNIPETDVLHEIKSDQESCKSGAVFADSNYAKVCEAPKYPSGNVTLNPNDSLQFLCLGLYDRIIRLCYLDSVRKEHKVALPNDAATFDAEVEKSLPKNASAVLGFCNGWKNEYPPRHSRTKLYVAQLESQLKDPILCMKLCTDGSNFIPLCSALARMDQLSVSTGVEPEKVKETQENKQTQTQAAQPRLAQQDAASSNDGTEKVAGDTAGSQEAAKKIETPEKVPDAPAKKMAADPKIESKLEKPEVEEHKETSKVASSAPAETKKVDEESKPQTENVGKISAPPLAANVASAKAGNEGQEEKTKSTKEESLEKTTVAKTTQTKSNDLSEKTSDAVSPSADGASAAQNQGPLGEDDNDAVISQNTQDRPEDADGQEGQDNPLDTDPASLPIDDGDQTAVQPVAKQEYNPRMPSIPNEDDSHFFGYFTVIGVICIAGYVGYHNKQKILAMVLEGRRSRGGRSRRRPSTANYRKLDCTLEEAVTSQCNSNVTHVIY